jgi:hypothetical protein
MPFPSRGTWSPAETTWYVVAVSSGSVHAQTQPRFIRHRRRTEWHAVPEGYYCAPTCFEMSVVDSQSLRSKYNNSIHCKPQNHSRLEEVADVLRNHPNVACVKLICRLFFTVPTQPAGEWPASSFQTRCIPHSWVWLCSLGQTRGKLCGCLSERWWFSRQEARNGTVPQWTKGWYLPSEQDARWVWSVPMYHELCLRPDGQLDFGRRQQSLHTGA